MRYGLFKTASVVIALLVLPNLANSQVFVTENSTENAYKTFKTCVVNTKKPNLCINEFNEYFSWAKRLIASESTIAAKEKDRLVKILKFLDEAASKYGNVAITTGDLNAFSATEKIYSTLQKVNNKSFEKYQRLVKNLKRDVRTRREINRFSIPKAGSFENMDLDQFKDQLKFVKKLTSIPSQFPTELSSEITKIYDLSQQRIKRYQQVQISRIEKTDYFEFDYDYYFSMVKAYAEINSVPHNQLLEDVSSENFISSFYKLSTQRVLQYQADALDDIKGFIYTDYEKLVSAYAAVNKTTTAQLFNHVANSDFMKHVSDKFHDEVIGMTNEFKEQARLASTSIFTTSSFSSLIKPEKAFLAVNTTFFKGIESFETVYNSIPNSAKDEYLIGYDASKLKKLSSSYSDLYIAALQADNGDYLGLLSLVNNVNFLEYPEPGNKNEKFRSAILNVYTNQSIALGDRHRERNVILMSDYDKYRTTFLEDHILEILHSNMINSLPDNRQSGVEATYIAVEVTKHFDLSKTEFLKIKDLCKTIFLDNLNEQNISQTMETLGVLATLRHYEDNISNLYNLSPEINISDFGIPENLFFYNLPYFEKLRKLYENHKKSVNEGISKQRLKKLRKASQNFIKNYEVSLVKEGLILDYLSDLEKFDNTDQVLETRDKFATLSYLDCIAQFEYSIEDLDKINNGIEEFGFWNYFYKDFSIFKKLFVTKYNSNTGDQYIVSPEFLQEIPDLIPRMELQDRGVSFGSADKKCSNV